MFQGFTEALVVVSDLESVSAQWRSLAGWRELASGDLDSGWIDAWELPPGTRGREALLAPKDANSGGLRLVQLDGCEQQDIRSNPQPWDCGGLLDLNVRVNAMASRQAEFRAAGWRGPSDPVRWRFGEVTVSEWLTLGPDGLAMALIERLNPPLPTEQLPEQIGPIFNSSQVVADMPRSLAFYEDILGMSKFLHIRQPLLPGAGENPLGIPHNLVSELEVEIAILSPGGDMQGSVELIRMHGLEGRQFAGNSRPPNLGVLGLRFPASDLDGLCERLEDVGLKLAFAPSVLELPPIGQVRVAGLQAPEGAWLEFYTPV